MRRRTIYFYQKYKYAIPYIGLALLMWPNLFTAVFNLRPLPEYLRYLFVALGIALLLPHFLINSFIPSLKHHPKTAVFQLFIILLSLFMLLAPDKVFMWWGKF